MINTLKQFAAWVTSLKQSEFERAALRLTLNYMLGIFFVLLLSSLAIYFLAGRTIPTPPPEVEQVSSGSEGTQGEFSLAEFKEHLLNIILVVDLIILFITTIFAFFFARRTLRPIETLYHQQTRFLGDVAHELRTPLAVLKAGTESLLLHPRSPQEYVAFLKEMAEETDRLTNLSNDLLYLLKTQNQPAPAFHSVDLLALVQHQLELFQAYAADHQITLVGPTILDQILILGQADSLTRLLQNLLKNAIDYNHPAGTVTISLEAAADTINLSVTDTGCGIAAADQAKIFERFYKVDSARSQNGTGLGLAIVADIVKIHHGRISLKSEPGVGTTITVSLRRRLAS